MNYEETKTAKTADLVTFYNDNIELIPINAIGNRKPVKKFADRKTAEKRVQALIEDLHLLELLGEVCCPNCGIHLGNGWCSDEGNGGYEVNGEFIRMEREHCCLGCDEEFGEEIKRAAKSATRAAGIAASWEDPAIKAKRSQRSGVEVDGEYYRSVKAAYIALGLDLADHIQFRMLLKETKKQRDSDGRNWKIVPLNYK